MEKLAGNVAVVTGAASGIGLALARRLADEKMSVVLADVEGDALGAAAESLSEHGDRILAVVTDVSDPASVDALANQALERFGKVHLLCNNAGVAVAGLSWQLTLQDWQWCLGVNLMGVIHCVRRFVPHMVEHGESGHVVNTASMAGLFVSPMNAVYGVAKHGVVVLSETMHHELAMLGSEIKVSCLCPAWVRTNITDSQRNRPGGLAETIERPPNYEAMEQMIRSAVDSGMDPARVADKIVAAVEADQFWIYTHPEWLPIAKKRFELMMAGKNPQFDLALLSQTSLGSDS